jgi:hypothetical protein
VKGSKPVIQTLSSRLATTLLALAASAGVALAVDEVAVTPTDNGTAVKGLVYARPFELQEPYVYTWTKEQESITSGYVLVVEVDPAYAQPRDIASPVLYVGHRPAEVTNLGIQSGRMVVIVPGDTDLTSAPIFFGSIELPERVDRARGEAEVAAALALGIQPVGAQAARTALLAGGPALRTRSIDGVYRSLADVLTRYSPDEAGRIESLRLIPAN